MEVPDAVSTTSSSRGSSSSQTSSNEAGVSCNQTTKNNPTINADMVNALLERLKDHQAYDCTHSSPSSISDTDPIPEAAAAAPPDEETQVWSQDPAVNAMAVQLIVQELEQKGKAEVSSLIQTLLSRLEQQGATNTGPRNQIGLVDISQVAHATQAMDHDQTKPQMKTTTGEEAEERKLPAKRPYEAIEEQAQPAVASETADAGPAAAPPQETVPKDHQKPKKKPTRKEYLAALRQHLEILHRRGQESSVIPAFLRSANWEDEEEDGQSTSSSLAVRKVKRRRRKYLTKDQYYQELAADSIAEQPAGPIPQEISCVFMMCKGTTPEDPSNSKPKADASMEGGSFHNLTESDLSASVCSSSSNPDSSDFESSDFESSAAETTTDNTSSVQGRTVTFANDGTSAAAVNRNGGEDKAPSEAGATEPRAVSISSGGSEEGSN